MPHEFNPSAQGNPQVLYPLLFRPASQELLKFGRNWRWVGGEAGITMVLPPRGQKLDQHIHVHCVVTGGALSPGGERWIAAKPRLLLPVRALSAVCRGKYFGERTQAYELDELRFAGSTASLIDPSEFLRSVGALKVRDWVV